MLESVRTVPSPAGWLPLPLAGWLPLPNPHLKRDGVHRELFNMVHLACQLFHFLLHVLQYMLALPHCGKAGRVTWVESFRVQAVASMGTHLLRTADS